MKTFQVLLLFFGLTLSVAYAGEADVLKVEVKRSGDNVYYFDVTVTHKDEGWDHFANKWDVVAPDGTHSWHSYSLPPACPGTTIH